MVMHNTACSRLSASHVVDESIMPVCCIVLVWQRCLRPCVAVLSEQRASERWIRWARLGDLAV